MVLILHSVTPSCMRWLCVCVVRVCVWCVWCVCVCVVCGMCVLCVCVVCVSVCGMCVCVVCGVCVLCVCVWCVCLVCVWCMCVVYVCVAIATFQRSDRFSRNFVEIPLHTEVIHSRSQWPRGLRRRSTAARLLKLWVRIPPLAWMSGVSVVRCQVEVSATS